ncbi:hypothetical protein JKP88DRAFT_241017 [Tribonema minus]|uniref:Uncharacterized protein n=1 Tax=Tribonema minus TaxID=303371 RepID=A0A835ZCF1_9STRA|nr:hypothetical protein JKP88DRAFT_241017 [Tribonema minus]
MAEGEGAASVFDQFSLVVSKANKLRDAALEVNNKVIIMRDQLRRKKQHVQQLTEWLTALEERKRKIEEHMGRMTSATSELVSPAQISDMISPAQAPSRTNPKSPAQAPSRTNPEVPILPQQDRVDADARELAQEVPEPEPPVVDAGEDAGVDVLEQTQEKTREKTSPPTLPWIGSEGPVLKKSRFLPPHPQPVILKAETFACKGMIHSNSQSQVAKRVMSICKTLGCEDLHTETTPVCIHALKCFGYKALCKYGCDAVGISRTCVETMDLSTHKEQYEATNFGKRYRIERMSMRALYNALFGTNIPPKFNWKIPEHYRQFFIVLGINELLVQLIIAPLLFPLPRPNLLMGKLTFASALDVPLTVYTICTLMLLPRIASIYSTEVDVKNKGTALLLSRILMLLAFVLATALRDNATPLDVVVAGALTVQMFQLTKFDVISKKLFGGDIPPFDFDKKDSLTLAGILFGTWLVIALQYLHDVPGYREVTLTIQKILHGNEHLRIVGKLVELGALYAVPAMVASRNAKDYNLAYSSMFLTMLLASKMIPSKVMKAASSVGGGGIGSLAKRLI